MLDLELQIVSSGFKYDFDTLRWPGTLCFGLMARNTGFWRLWYKVQVCLGFRGARLGYCFNFGYGRICKDL